MRNLIIGRLLIVECWGDTYIVLCSNIDEKLIYGKYGFISNSRNDISWIDCVGGFPFEKMDKVELV
jgi:hypothetical protein